MPQRKHTALFVPPIQYLLRDEFTTDRAAGAVNGTPAGPGPGGNRTEGGAGAGRYSISGNRLVLSSGATANDSIAYDLITRSPGTVFLAKIDAYTGGQFGFTSSKNSTETLYHAFQVTGGQWRVRTTSGSFANLATFAAGDKIAIALRSAGAMFFIDNLLYIIDATGTAHLYPQVCDQGGASNTHSVDYVRTVVVNWLPAPLASDGFSAAFGISDGLGHAETTGIGSGGDGQAWTQQVGTWGISSGKAVATALSGGEAVATVPLSTANPLIGIDLARSAGNVGGVARWTDANNHLRWYHDGTNHVLQQVVSGTPTTLITAAATYSANAKSWLWLNGTTARLYYNNALTGSTSSINAGLTAANAGLRTTDTGNTMDNFTAYAVGAEGQYSNLNQY